MKHQDLFHKPVFNKEFMFNDFGQVEQRLHRAEQKYKNLSNSFNEMKSVIMGHSNICSNKEKQL